MRSLSKYTKIVDAKYDNKILFVVAIDSAGKTDQLIFRFDENYENYDVRKHENISFTGINFVVLENGVCVNINPLDQVEVFTNNVTSQTLKIIDDPIISNDMTLYKNGMQVLFSNGPKLYSIKMK